MTNDVSTMPGPDSTKTTCLVSLSEINTEAGTQIRAKMDIDTIDLYANSMMDGDKFPPIVVFHDGSQYILADGFHRVMAYTRNGTKEIDAIVKKGSKSEALKYALGANATHGKPRTNADKHCSVELALEEWPKLSNVEVGRICAVSKDMVRIFRDKSQPATLAGSEPRLGADGKVRRMPKKRSKEPAPPPEPDPEDEPPRVKSADEEMEEPEKRPHKPTTRRQSNGMQFAKIATSQLERIQPKDTQRQEAYDYVLAWINKHLL